MAVRFIQLVSLLLVACYQSHGPAAGSSPIPTGRYDHCSFGARAHDDLSILGGSGADDSTLTVTQSGSIVMVDYMPSGGSAQTLRFSAVGDSSATLDSTGFVVDSLS